MIDKSEKEEKEFNGSINRDKDDETSSYRKKAEKQMIINKLNSHKWNIQETANDLGIHRTTLWRKMKKLGIK